MKKISLSLPKPFSNKYHYVKSFYEVYNFQNILNWIFKDYIDLYYSIKVVSDNSICMKTLALWGWAFSTIFFSNKYHFVNPLYIFRCDWYLFLLILVAYCLLWPKLFRLMNYDVHHEHWSVLQGWLLSPT